VRREVRLEVIATGAPAAAPREAWNRRATAYFARAAFGVVTVWIALTTLLRAHGPTGLWVAFDLPFRLLCHRIPERVMDIAGTPLPLCSRCTGIWLGMSVSAALAWPALPLRVLRVVVPAAMVFMLGEVVTQDLGWHPVYHPTRLLSGLLLSVPFGGAIGKLITDELLGPAEARRAG
jgi:uncharacterized membrane protein